MKEWFDFEREAINQLRQRFRSILVQVLDWPSFGSPAAWSVEEHGGRSHGKRYSCTYEVWSRHYDYTRCSEPLERVRYLNRLVKPTITRRVIDTVPDEDVRALLRRAETLPAISSCVAIETRTVTLDGFLTEAAFSNGLAQVRYSWTNEAPVHWQVVAAYAEEVRSFIRTASQQHGWLVESQPN
jgi:hypothetical protein